MSTPGEDVAPATERVRVGARAGTSSTSAQAWVQARATGRRRNVTPWTSTRPGVPSARCRPTSCWPCSRAPRRCILGASGSAAPGSVGEFSWQWQHLVAPLELLDCVIDQPIVLDHGELAGLTLKRCRVPGLSAEEVTSHSTVNLTGSAFAGVVVLRDSRVIGPSCWPPPASRAPTGDPSAVPARHAVAGERVMSLERGFSATGGGVYLTGARSAGPCFCDGAQLSNPGGDAFRADLLDVHGDLFMRTGFRADGRVKLVGARIGGRWDCTGGVFHASPDQDAIRASNVQVVGSVFFPATVPGDRRVRLFNARLGALHCRAARFTGGVQFMSARIAGSVGFAEAVLKAGGNQEALDFANAAIAGNLYLNEGFTAHGSVQLTSAGSARRRVQPGTFPAIAAFAKSSALLVATGLEDGLGEADRPGDPGQT